MVLVRAVASRGAVAGCVIQSPVLMVARVLAVAVAVARVRTGRIRNG